MHEYKRVHPTLSNRLPFTSYTTLTLTMSVGIKNMNIL